MAHSSGACNHGKLWESERAMSGEGTAGDSWGDPEAEPERDPTWRDRGSVMLIERMCVKTPQRSLS